MKRGQWGTRDKLTLGPPLSSQVRKHERRLSGGGSQKTGTGVEGEGQNGKTVPDGG